MVPFWREAIDMVLDVEPGEWDWFRPPRVPDRPNLSEEDSSKIPDVSIVESSAELLYGLCHQRFILTKAGLASMVRHSRRIKRLEANMQVEKYEEGHFGVCPRVFCHQTHVLPCGRADMPGVDTVKLFCPNCGDIFVPPSSKYQSVDGALCSLYLATRPLLSHSYSFQAHFSARRSRPSFSKPTPTSSRNPSAPRRHLPPLLPLSPPPPHHLLPARALPWAGRPSPTRTLTAARNRRWAGSTPREFTASKSLRELDRARG